MINVHISPDYLDKKDTGDGGIRRVSEAMIKHLPKFDVQHVRNPKDAHIIVNHGAMLTHVPGVPSVNVNHGLYWSRQPWEGGYQQVNADVVESMCRAVAHTAPSEWVARAIRRGGLFFPEVVMHGIDSEDFAPSPVNAGYVLWAKGRADYVSDPTDMQRVAVYLPGVDFWTTIGQQTSNVKVIGTTDYTRMKTIVANAGVYLCTTRETFGIGTLEALASGTPVAGFAWGGQEQIILQGETGFLAPPGDFQGLSECIQRCLDDRKRLSANAVEDARTRWKWEPRIEQYANLFKRVYSEFYDKKYKKVTILVTACKLDQYLPQCLDSVLRQTFQDFECLVIDDAQLQSTKLIVEDYAKRDGRIRYIPTPHNLGLPGARNFGFHRSSGRYIRHLDADDYLADNALALEAEALDNDPAIHIAYGHLETVREDGTRILDHGEPVRGDWPPSDFDWVEQMAHLNQLPSCVMMRREVMERSAGYRDRMKRAEDAEFWCRVTSQGFRAKKFTQAVTYFHRQRGDSKGAQEWAKEGKEPDWTAWFPWRVGAGDYNQAVTVMRRHGGRHPAPRLVPFAAQGKCPDRDFWMVHDFAYPVVSIIVTCGPAHEHYLMDALDSIRGQSYPDWECTVVNDTGKPWGKDLLGAPWAKVVNMDGNRGTAAARNEGFRQTHGRGHFVVWMDADDYWLPWFLELLVASAEKNAGIIYPDLIMDDGKQKKIYRYAEFDPDKVATSMRYPGSSVLIPRGVAQAVFDSQGGWDEQIPGMEDWDFQIAMHAAGFCAYHLEEPLFVYRMYSSTKRENDYSKIEVIKEYLDKKWFKYRKGSEKPMCGCAQKHIVRNQPNSTLSSSGSFDTIDRSEDVIQTQMVQVEYMGPIEEDFSIRSQVDRGIFYRFGNNQYHKERTVFMHDAQFLTGLLDGNGRPLYRIVGTVAAMENRDPSSFLGEAVAA